MKPTHSDVTSSLSCSCTSCTYKSESERSSLKKIVSKGSKVDKLYLTKYIPLRERKLLGKLVRTRAVYDDIRNQLVSESSLSVSEKVDFRPWKNLPRDRNQELDDAERSSVLLELVDLVDKGAALESRRLSECCSCCGCGSIYQHEHQGRGHTHRQGRPLLSSRSSLFSTRRANDERRKGRHKQQKAKHISSDPCTCTAKFREMLIAESKSLKRELSGKKPKPIYKPIGEFEENRMRASRQVKDFKVKQAGMGESIRRSLTKLKRSSTRISKKIKTGTKKSLETIQRTQQKVKDKIKESAKPVKQQNNIPNDEVIANAIRDALLTYKEGLEFDPNFWLCDFVCDPEECEPEKCFEALSKKILKNSEMQGEKYETETATKTIDNNIGGKNVEIDKIKIKDNETPIRKKSKNKNSKVQESCLCESTGSKTALKTKSVKSNTSVHQKSSKASVKSVSGHKISESAHEVSTVPTPTEKKTPSKLALETMNSEREAKSKQLNFSSPITPSTKRKERQARKGSWRGFSIEFRNEKPIRQLTPSEHRNIDKELDIKSGNQKQQRSSSTTQNTKKNTRSGGLALKRCLCTLKIKPHKNIPNLNKMHPNNVKPTVSKSLQTNTSPQEFIQKREMDHPTVITNHTKPSKSVSSGDIKNMETQKTSRDNTIVTQPINARSSQQNKQIERGKTMKQAVRISSNFSFNIEFYKDGGDHAQSNLTTTRPSLNTKNKGNNKKQFRELTHKPSQISSSGKSKYTLTKHKLRRCFCTLKLAKTGQKNHSRGTLTSGQGLITTAPIVVDRATEKRERNSIIKYTLLPYECEPGICIPGECDPYKCLNIIKERKIKTHARQSGTDQRRTKSTYSITRRKPISVKSVNLQSITSRQNTEKVTPRRKPVHRETTLSSGASNKQAIRIGSSFSFNVEFYKEKSPSLLETHVKQVEPKHVGIKTQIKSKKSQGQTVIKHQKSSSVQNANKNKEALTQSNLKRCFCTLKLHKTAKHKTQLANTGTEPAFIKEEMYPKMETTTKSTNTKKIPHIRQLEPCDCEPNVCILGQCSPDMCLERIKIRDKVKSRKLEPYECEPNFCIPGQCDPNLCLERIKIRDKVKCKEFGTVTNKLKVISVSSASDNNYKKSKDAMSQSFKKAKQIKRTNNTSSVNNSKASIEKHKSTTRQATRIGSNFSFNIEFSKDISSKSQDVKENVNVKKRPKAINHRGNNFGGKPAKQSISQTSEIKRITKSTGIRPILKRCFCTRKLQNKNNFPTVLPVLLQNSFSTFYKEELIRFRNMLSKQVLRNRTYVSSLSSIFSSTYTESSVYTAHKDFKNYHRSSINKYGLVISSTSLITKIKKENTLIGINQYLKSSFYTMNMHVQNKQKYKHKLEPYECEPGVCIPGQCDPIECQKLIMKRLMKKVSTMTATEKKSQAFGPSGALQSKSKKQQFDKDPGAKVEKEQQGFKYKTLPRTNKQKQAVRVGSSFSFNIEFSKDRTTAKQTPQEIIYRGKKDKGEASSTNTIFKKHESKSTSGSQVLRQHRTSQSGTAMHDKGSNITPKIKRCFCTLKIQKRGRQNKTSDHKVKKKHENKVDEVKTADAGQNTKKIKPYSLSDLDPNECEPNVCIPGECDPYECLERIKKRGQRRNTKDFGTDMKPQKMTTSSMTSSQKQASKAKQAHIKDKTLKPGAGAPNEKQYTKPSNERQVVRIGSSFSFDIEFFKDKSCPGEANITTIMPSKAAEHKQTKSQKAGKEKNIKEISVQDSKSKSHQDTQVVLPAQHEKSTKTGSLIQRCFCTLKLNKQNKSPKTQEKSPSFVDKCFCTLKLAIAKQKQNLTKVPPKTEKNNASAQTKKTKTKRQEQKVKTLKLDPNECEPGVCVPGECDPLICIERIRKRNALNKMSSTEASGTRSVSTFLESSKVSKSTASNPQTQNKSKTSKPEVKRRSQSEKRAKSSERSAVRIGSNFSFNIEFYKDKTPTYQQLQMAYKEMKQSGTAATESTKLISHSAMGTDNNILSQDCESQVDHVKKSNKSSDVGMLKRCFCTLALQKQTAGQKEAKKKKDVKQKEAKMEMSTKGTETPNKKIKNINEYKSKPYKLEPYECEPGICIPGECNPYECEKLIKKRQRREFGTKTLKQTSKSATTATKREGKKNHKVQNEALNRARSRDSKHEPVKRVSISPKGHARQAVRVGSNFSFNIEFSKSNTGNVSKTEDENSKPVKNKAHNDTQSQSAKYRHQKTQGKRDVHHAYSQVFAKKVRSTVTEVAPLLKRCFCTLTLRNEKLAKEKVIHPIPKKNPPKKPTPSQVDKVTHTDQQHKLTLDPNECEPGTCIPGQCNPHECLKRIQKRMLSKMSNTDATRAKKTATTTSKPDRTSAKTSTGKNKRQPPRESGDNERTEKRRPSQSPTTIAQGNRQAVRIGSNFSFNIEFFKDAPNNNGMTSPQLEKNHKIAQHRIQSTGDSQGQNHAASGYQTKLVDRQLQSHGHATESKGSGVGPLMKRCFCTLKLQKVGKLHQKPPKSVKKTKDNAATAKIKVKIDDSKISKDASTRTKKKHRVLEPYECEPNTCIPGKCNPLECLERIKLRNLNDFGTDVMKTSTKSTSSLTDGKGQPKTNQTQLKKSAGPKSNEPAKRIPEHVSYAHTAENPNRQSVRLDSSFNFALEFFKEPPQNKEAIDNVTYEPSSIGAHQKIKTKPIKTKSQDSSSKSFPSYHKGQQAHVLKESVGSGITPLLKRCFCTLTLHNTETNKITCPKGKKPTVSSQNKATSTKKLKKIKISNLDSNEFDQCDPQKGLERIKKKGIRRQSRTMSPSKKDAQVQNNIVEQPRFPFISRHNWQGMRIGSNISFNIEFYKEPILPDANDFDENNSGVSKCGCKTAKKIKKKRTKKSECKCLTVGRVEKIITLTPYKPTQCYVYKVKQLGHACSDDVETEIKTACKYKDYFRLNQQKTKHLPKDIKTILPYKPRQFCKNGSNTLFSLKCVAKGAENYCYSYRAYQDQRFKEENTSNVRKFAVRETSSHIRLSSKEKRMILPQKSAATALKKFFFTQFAKCKIESDKQIDLHNYNIDSLNTTADVLKKSKSDRSSVKCPLSQPKKSKSCKTTVIQKKKYIDTDNKQSSRLQSGDAILSENTPVLGKGVVSNYRKHTEDTCNNAYCESKRTNYPLSTKKNITSDTSPKRRIMVECSRKLGKCKEKIQNFHMSPMLKYIKSNSVYENNDQYSKDTGLMKLNASSIKSKIIEGGVIVTGDVNKDLESPCVFNQLKTGENRKQIKKKLKKTSPKSAQQWKSYKKYAVLKKQKKKRIKVMRSKKKFRDDSLQQSSVLNAAKLGPAAVDVLRTTKGKLKEHTATNYLINKYHSRNKKKIKEPSRFGCGSMSSPRKKPWLAIYYCCPWFYQYCSRAFNIWKQSTEVVLFALAVVVWSPCTFLVESCKAAKCCNCMS